MFTTISTENEPRSDVPLSKLSDNGIFYQLESSIILAPGYDPMSSAVGETVVSNPQDRYSTNIQLPNKTIFSVVSKVIELPEEKDREENLLTSLRRKLFPQKLTEITPPKSTFVRSYQIKSIADESIAGLHAHVTLSPLRLPEKYRGFIEDGYNHILEEDLVIFPDYSNLSNSSEKEGILLTPEMFGIKVYRGSRVMFREGGGDKNLSIKIFDGKIIVNTGNKVIPWISEFHSKKKGLLEKVEKLSPGIEEM
jgi:hypothetical protein